VSSAPQPSDYHDALTEQALHLVGRRDSGIALILIELAGFRTAPDGTVREAARRLAAGRLLTALDMDVAMGVSRIPADAARGRARQLGRRHYRLYAR
jgi:hypothetical protein